MIVIAFPKTTTGQCLMSNAPSPVSDEQLKELNLSIIKK
jgi:aspartyl-tRNA synthetase